MIRRHIPLAVLALVPALLLGSAHAAGPRHPVSGASPQSFALTVADVTHVYGPVTKLAGIALPNTYSAGTRGVTSLSAKGRVSAYGVIFLTMRRPAAWISNSVDLYRSSAYARAAVQNILNMSNRVRGHTVQGRTLRISPLSGVGETAALLTIQRPGRQAGQRGYYLVLDFSRGAYTSSVQIIAEGKLALSRVLALARIVDQRIQSRGSGAAS